MTGALDRLHAPTVLVLGGTGRTGRRVVEQLLQRGCTVRAIVRATRTLPPAVLAHPALTVIVGNVLAVDHAALVRVVHGCDAVISCLGHVISLRGVFGPPFDLVTRATQRVCAAIEADRPVRPVRFILMSSVSVNHPAAEEPLRGTIERIILAVLRTLLPPARDNQRAVDFLAQHVGTSHPDIEWVAVRPDTLREGDASEWSVHPRLVRSLFSPASTRMANVAHFMADLASTASAWAQWSGGCPVIIDAPTLPARGDAIAARGPSPRRPRD